VAVQNLSSANGNAAQQYNIDYTVVYKNNDRLPLSGVTIAETLPAGSTFLSDQTRWKTTDGVTFRITVGDLASGNSGSVVFLVETGLLNVGDVVTDTVSATDDGSHGPDQLLSNNVSTVDVTVTGPATATPTTGGGATYRIFLPMVMSKDESGW
jgi:uncharacterized repeat protein (TIGR01451 family)